MSAGVCGKRVGFEEIFGSSSSSPTSLSSAKRSRCAAFGSPGRSTDLGSGPDENSIPCLLQMFPSLDPELVESVLSGHDNKIDDTTQSLHYFSTTDARSEFECMDNVRVGVVGTIPCPSMSTCGDIPRQAVLPTEDVASTSNSDTLDGAKWVELFVNEMIRATDSDDARTRTAKILEAFERSMSTRFRVSKEQIEYVSLREYLQGLLKDNHILKRAVAIQRERNLEQEEKTSEMQQIKHLLSQYQEQIRTLELNNYALKLHLQKAQESSFIHGRHQTNI